MLCYDRTKVAVNGPQLARMTQRLRGYTPPSFSVNSGQVLSGQREPTIRESIGDIAEDVAVREIDRRIDDYFSGMQARPADKRQFDSVRQNVWNQFAAIVNPVDGLKSSNQLTRESLQTYMRSLQNLLDSFNKYYNRVRPTVTPAYGDSRFHDFYDPMLSKYNEWTAELATMGGAGYFGTGGGLLGGTGGMLLLAAVGLAIFAGSRK